MTLAYAPEAPATPHVIADVMERLGVRMTFAKGEEIFGQDEPADLIHSVVSGAVRTTRLLSDGRRQIGNFYYAGDLIGLETGEIHRFSGEALTDCTILVVKRASLRAFSGDGELDRAIWEATRRELERTQEHLLGARPQDRLREGRELPPRPGGAGDGPWSWTCPWAARTWPTTSASPSRPCRAWSPSSKARRSWNSRARATSG